LKEEYVSERRSWLQTLVVLVAIAAAVGVTPYTLRPPEVVPAVAGVQPDEVLREVVIIDCTVLLPLLFFGGLKLWRREAWGYVLGGLLLVKVLATDSTLAFTTALGAWWARAINPFDAFLFVLFALMAIGAFPLLVTYLRCIQEGGARKANVR
jgi:hypothetical protein